MVTVSYFLNEAGEACKVLAVQGRQWVRPRCSGWALKEILADHRVVHLSCTSQNKERSAVDVSSGKGGKERSIPLSLSP